MSTKVDVYKDRFDRLVAVTKKLCPDVKKWDFSRGREKRWYDFFEYWDRLDKNVIFGAMHHIYWGFYPDMSYSENELELMGLIEYEIKNHGEAYDVWFDNDDVVCTFQYVVDQKKSCGAIEQKSVVHSEMMGWLTSYEVLRGKQGYFNRPPMTAYFYKEFVYKLIPESVYWSRTQWMDEESIFKALEDRYGMDFREVIIFDEAGCDEDVFCYDLIFEFYKYLNFGGRDGAIATFLQIPVFTKDLLDVLLDGDADTFVIEAYLKAYKYAELNERKCSWKRMWGVLKRDIRKSYLHKYIQRYSVSTEMPQLKIAIFNVEITAQ